MTTIRDNSSLVSIAVPAFNEEGNIAELCAQVRQAMDAEIYRWELILVDDGSTDSTWAEITKANTSDSRIKGLRLSRNFGHQYALMAGMRAAIGDAVITADADLQHPPEVFSQLLKEWDAGSRIVQTIRENDDDLGPLKRFSSRQFYRFFRLLSGVELQAGMADFRLLDRKVLDDITAFGEQGLFLRGIIQWVGYPIATVRYQARRRFSGNTKYSFIQMLKLAWHGVSSFSNVPLRIGVFSGIGASVISLAAVGHAIYSKLITGSAVAGWASSLAIISFLFAVLFVYLGVLGEYVARIATEVRSRPRYLVSEKLGVESEIADSAAGASIAEPR